MESYCEICQKEFCNKYFLKKHKYKIHGIGEPSTPQNTNSCSNTSMHSIGNVISTSPTNICAITTTTSMANTTSPVNGERKSPSPATSTTSGIGSSSPPLCHQVERCLAITLTEKPVFPVQQQPQQPPPQQPQQPNAEQRLVCVSTSSGNFQQSMDFTCEICKSDFANLFTLQNHRILAHGETGVPALLSPYNGGGSGGGTSPGSASGIDRGEAGCNTSVFTPEKLREMGVINADAFCEICCKEFCNKYFLKTHKQNKHGIGGAPEGGGSSTSSNKPQSIHSSNSNSGPGPDKMDESSHKSFDEFHGSEGLFRFPGELDLMSSGGELNCEICNRPFSSVYLLKMHKFYTHNVPYIKEEGRSKPGSPISAQMPPHPPPPNSTSSAGQPEEEPATTTEDSANHDLQKLQSMIRELNASVSFESICTRTPCSICHVEFENKYFLRAHMMNEHGVLPTEDGHIPFPYVPGGSTNASTTSGNGDGEGKGDSEAYCELCNKEFCSKYFLKTHRQNIHGIPMEPFPLIRKPSGMPFLAPPGQMQQQQLQQQQQQMQQQQQQQHQQQMQEQANAQINSSTNNSSNNPTQKLKAILPPIPTSSSTTVPSPVAFPNSAADDLSPGKQSRNVTGRNYCNICNKELCNKYFMKTHMLKMHGINLENQSGEAAKNTSMGSIGTIGGVTCDICQKELCSKYFLKVHKQNTHGIFEDPPKDCPTSMVMVGSGGGMEHPSMHRELLPGEVSDTNNRYYSHYTEVCPLCDRRFKSIKWLKSHMVNDHSDVLKDNLFINNHHLQPLLPHLSLMPGSTTPESSDTLCLVCGQEFPDKTTLQLHLIRDHRTTTEELGLANHRIHSMPGSQGHHHHHHHSSKASSQPLPDSSSSSSAALLAIEGHPVPTSTASPGSPPLSPFRSSPSPSPVYEKHPLMSSAVKRISLMGGTRIYQCSYCAYSTRWLSNLYAHEKRHSGFQVPIEGDKRFICRLCHRAYRYNHSLQRHMLNHHRGLSKGQPPLLHPQTSLSKDGKTIVKMKRYRCSKCNRKFRTRDLCLAHIHAAHRKGNPNNNNNSNSGLNLSLGNHQQQQDQDSAPEMVDQSPERHSSTPRPVSKSSSVRPYRCRLCPFATRSWNALKLHISKLHPELPEDLSGGTKDRPQSNGGLPMTYAMPQNPPTAGSFIMQPFLLAQQPPEGGDTFVPSLVYLPVCHKISQPVTVAFSLTPA